jgi:hypothetical protein
VVGVDLSRVEAVALSESALSPDAERSSLTPQDVPQQANDAAAVDTDEHVDGRTLIVPLATCIVPPKGDVVMERTLGVPVAYTYASPEGKMVMSSESPSRELPILAQPDPSLVLNLLVRIADGADEPVPDAPYPEVRRAGRRI